MKSKIVYVTSDEAHILTLKAEGEDISTLHKHGPRHPHEAFGKNHLKKNDDTEHFLHELANLLQKDDARVLIVGPAQAKVRLKSHIEREHPMLATKVVGVESMDKATLPQIAAFGRKFFTKLSAFEAI